jgi:hypothetical protein
MLKKNSNQTSLDRWLKIKKSKEEIKEEEYMSMSTKCETPPLSEVR